MMGEQSSTDQTAAQARRADNLDPEVREILHMLQTIEDNPDACNRTGRGRR